MMVRAVAWTNSKQKLVEQIFSSLDNFQMDKKQDYRDFKILLQKIMTVLTGNKYLHFRN